MFYLFTGYDYYPVGGSHDFIAKSDVAQDLVDRVANEKDLEWWHICDENMQLTQEGRRS